jgi:hypothetical protein
VWVWIVDSGWQREGAYNRLRLRKAEAGGRPHSVTSWAVEATSGKRRATLALALALHVGSLSIGASLCGIGAVQTLALDSAAAS